MKKIDINKFKSILWVLVGVVGLITVIFAILGYTNAKVTDPGSLLKYISATGLVVAGLALLLLGFIKDKESKAGNILDLFSGSILLGVGIFLFIDKENKFIESIVKVIVPIILACFGCTLFVKAVIGLIKKEPTKSILTPLICGALLVTLGIVFYILAPKNEYIVDTIWLLIGLTMIGYSILSLVKIIKSNKPKSVETETNQSMDNTNNPSQQ